MIINLQVHRHSLSKIKSDLLELYNHLDSKALIQLSTQPVLRVGEGNTAGEASGLGTVTGLC